MKHSVDEIHTALKVYKEGIHGDKLLVPKITISYYAKVYSPQPTIMQYSEFTRRELELYDSKLLREMYAE